MYCGPVSWTIDRRKERTHVVRIVVGLAEIVRHGLYHAVLQIRGALGEHALGRAFDVRREHTIRVWLVQDDKRPFVCRVERHLKHLGEALLVLVIPRAELAACKARETRLCCVPENLPLVEGHVRLVELDARVERCDVDHLRHARRLERERRCRLLVVVRLEGRVHPPTAPEVRDRHLVARQSSRLVRGE